MGQGYEMQLSGDVGCYDDGRACAWGWLYLYENKQLKHGGLAGRWEDAWWKLHLTYETWLCS